METLDTFTYHHYDYARNVITATFSFDSIDGERVEDGIILELNLHTDELTVVQNMTDFMPEHLCTQDQKKYMRSSLADFWNGADYHSRNEVLTKYGRAIFCADEDIE